MLPDPALGLETTAKATLTFFTPFKRADKIVFQKIYELFYKRS
jgi:hypothetical protein